MPDETIYDLRAYVIMSNHVRLLLCPLVPPDKLLQSIKAFSAREANRLLNRTGELFWQKEGYDRWMRTAQEAANCHRYIEHNPMKAGLVANPEEWRWSGA